MCAVVAVIAAAAAVAVFPSFAGAGPGLGWAVGALVTAALMLAICVIQVAVWRRAMASWLGKRVQDLRAEKQLSWIAHLVSYAVTLAALFTTMAGSARAWLGICIGCAAGGHLALRSCRPGARRSAVSARTSSPREHSQHTFGALIGGPVTATIDASWSRSRSRSSEMRVYGESEPTLRRG